MIRKYVAAVLLAGMTGGQLAGAEAGSPDAQAIEQLVRNGADVSKLHRIEFTLRFGTQKAAERAEGRLLELAFSTKLERGNPAEEWLVRGAKRMYPVESDLAGLRDKLNAIAAEGRGDYAGWRAQRVAPGD